MVVKPPPDGKTEGGDNLPGSIPTSGEIVTKDKVLPQTQSGNVKFDAKSKPQKRTRSHRFPSIRHMQEKKIGVDFLRLKYGVDFFTIVRLGPGIQNVDFSDFSDVLLMWDRARRVAQNCKISIDGTDLPKTRSAAEDKREQRKQLNKYYKTPLTMKIIERLKKKSDKTFKLLIKQNESDEDIFKVINSLQMLNEILIDHVSCMKRGMRVKIGWNKHDFILQIYQKLILKANRTNIKKLNTMRKKYKRLTNTTRKLYYLIEERGMAEKLISQKRLMVTNFPKNMKFEETEVKSQETAPPPAKNSSEEKKEVKKDSPGTAADKTEEAKPAQPEPEKAGKMESEAEKSKANEQSSNEGKDRTGERSSKEVAAAENKKSEEKAKEKEDDKSPEIPFLNNAWESVKGMFYSNPKKKEEQGEGSKTKKEENPEEATTSLEKTGAAPDEKPSEKKHEPAVEKAAPAEKKAESSEGKAEPAVKKKKPALKPPGETKPETNDVPKAKSVTKTVVDHEHYQDKKFSISSFFKLLRPKSLKEEDKKVAADLPLRFRHRNSTGPLYVNAAYLNDFFLDKPQAVNELLASHVKKSNDLTADEIRKYVRKYEKEKAKARKLKFILEVAQARLKENGIEYDDLLEELNGSKTVYAGLANKSIGATVPPNDLDMEDFFAESVVSKTPVAAEEKRTKQNSTWGIGQIFFSKSSEKQQQEKLEASRKERKSSAIEQKKHQMIEFDGKDTEPLPTKKKDSKVKAVDDEVAAEIKNLSATAVNEPKHTKDSAAFSNSKETKKEESSKVEGKHEADAKSVKSKRSKKSEKQGKNRELQKPETFVKFTNTKPSADTGSPFPYPHMSDSTLGPAITAVLNNEKAGELPSKDERSTKEQSTEAPVNEKTEDLTDQKAKLVEQENPETQVNEKTEHEAQEKTAEQDRSGTQKDEKTKQLAPEKPPKQNPKGPGTEPSPAEAKIETEPPPQPAEKPASDSGTERDPVDLLV